MNETFSQLTISIKLGVLTIYHLRSTTPKKSAMYGLGPQKSLGPDAPTPDPEQAAAIGAVEGNVQVIARAGSGKTATLVNRAKFLSQHCRGRCRRTVTFSFQ